MTLRILWKVFDLIAIALVTSTIFIFTPLYLLMELGVLACIPLEAKLPNLVLLIISLSAVLGGIFGTITLCMTVTVSREKICSNQLFKNTVFVGLIAGIIASIYGMVWQFNIYLLVYMVVSASSHLLDLFWLKKGILPDQKN